MITFYLAIFRYKNMDSNTRLKIFIMPLILEILLIGMSPVWIRAILRLFA